MILLALYRKKFGTSSQSAASNVSKSHAASVVKLNAP
jgi:hypothetical protein